MRKILSSRENFKVHRWQRRGLKFAIKVSATSARFKMPQDESESENEHCVDMAGDDRLAKILRNGKPNRPGPPEWQKVEHERHRRAQAHWRKYKTSSRKKMRMRRT